MNYLLRQGILIDQIHSQLKEEPTMSRNRILALVAFYALLVGLTLFGFNTPTTASAQSCSPTYFTLSGALNATQSGTGIAVSMGFVDVFDVHHFDLMRNDSTIKTPPSRSMSSLVSKVHTPICSPIQVHSSAEPLTTTG